MQGCTTASITMRARHGLSLAPVYPHNKHTQMLAYESRLTTNLEAMTAALNARMYYCINYDARTPRPVVGSCLPTQQTHPDASLRVAFNNKSRGNDRSAECKDVLLHQLRCAHATACRWLLFTHTTNTPRC